jgi:hypothetical protein
MTRSPSLYAAIQRLREQAKIEATVLLDAARGAVRHVQEAFAFIDGVDDDWWEAHRRRLEVSISEWQARDLARRLYMAAMSQASQPASTPKERWRLRTLSVESLRRADQRMRLAGLDPESHPRRSMTVRRMRERGIVIEEE